MTTPGVQPARWTSTPLRLVALGATLYTLNAACISLRPVTLTAAVLIALGVSRLATTDVGSPRYATLIRIAQAIAVAHVVLLILSFTVFSRVVRAGMQFWAFLPLAGVVLFCLAMIQLARHYALPRAELSWRLTTTFAIVCYVAPTAAFRLSVVAMRYLGVFYFPYTWFFMTQWLAVFPLVHVWLSIARMNAESVTGPTGGFPVLPVPPRPFADSPPRPFVPSPPTLPPSRPDPADPPADSPPRT